MLTWCQAELSRHLGSIEAGTVGMEIWMGSRRSPTACAEATAASWHRLTEKLLQHQGDGYFSWQRDLKVPDFGGCKTDLVHVLHSSNPGQLWVANNEGGEKSRESISHLSDEGTAGDKSTMRDPLGMLSNTLIPSLLISIFPPLKFSIAN